MKGIIKQVIDFFGPIRLIIILASMIMSLILILYAPGFVPQVKLHSFKVDKGHLTLKIKFSNPLPAKLVIDPFEISVDPVSINTLLRHSSADTLKAFTSKIITIDHKILPEEKKWFDEIDQLKDTKKQAGRLSGKIDMEILKIKGRWNMR